MAQGEQNPQGGWSQEEFEQKMRDLEVYSHTGEDHQHRQTRLPSTTLPRTRPTFTEPRTPIEERVNIDKPPDPPPSAEAPSGTGFKYTPPEERTLLGHLGNYPGSAYRLGESFVDLIRHPIQTFEDVGKIGIGAMTKLTGILDDPDMDPNLKAALMESTGVDTVEALVGAIEERYGSWDAFSNTAYQDPVGVIADVTGLLSAGGGALRVPGAIFKPRPGRYPSPNALRTTAPVEQLGNLGEEIQRLARKYDPINVAGSGAEQLYKGARWTGGKISESVLGISSGAGAMPVNLAFNMPGSRALKNAMSGKTGGAVIVENARDGLHKMRQNRAEQYRSQLADIIEQSGDVIMELAPVRRALEEGLVEFKVNVSYRTRRSGKVETVLDFSRTRMPEVHQAAIQKVAKIIDDWGSQAGDTGVLGMDTLKQTLGQQFSPHADPANIIAMRTTRAARQQLVDAIPGYEKMTRTYQDMSDMIREIESELSMGSRKTKGATLRKLATIISRDGDYRQALIQSIDANTATALMEQLAGYALKDYVPHTLVGRGMAMAAISGMAVSNLFSGNPLVLAMAISNSPRLVGEILLALGTVRKGMQAITPGLRVPVQVLATPGIARPLELIPPDIGPDESSETLMGPPMEAPPSP